MIDWIKQLFMSRYLGSIVRHAMTALSGFLLAIGIEPEVVESFASSGTTVLIAVLTYVIAQGFSYLEKKQR